MSEDSSAANRANLPFSIDNILREDFGPNRSQLRTFPRHYNPVGFYVGIPLWYYRPRALLTLPTPPASLQCNKGRLIALAGAGDSDLDRQHCHDSSEERKDNASEEERDINTDAESTSDSDESVKLLSTGKRKHEDTADSRNEPKKKRPRTHFTEMQLKYLENYFKNSQSYLSRDERTVLAQALEMTELQIRNWFQNKRYQIKHKDTSSTTVTTSTKNEEERTETTKS